MELLEICKQAKAIAPNKKRIATQDFPLRFIDSGMRDACQMQKGASSTASVKTAFG